MADLTIHDVDDDAVATLPSKERDTAALEAEIRQMLEESKHRRFSTAELVELADRIAALTPDVPQTDSVELLREDRNR